MTTFEKAVKYFAIALAVFLSITIIGGIASGVGAVIGLFVGGDATSDPQIYSISGEINNLNIEISAAELSIIEGDGFCVESNLEGLKVNEKNGCLTIREKNRLFGSYSYENAFLKVYIPAEISFDAVDITTGAGKFTVDSLSAGTVDFEFGAGEVSIGNLTVTESADIEGGAGRITVSDGAIKDLDMDMGVGQLNLTSSLSGDCKMDLGVGESNITLIGDKDDYRVELDRGLGNVSVDGKSVSDFGSSGSGVNKVEINGGIGAINIRFGK